MNSIKAFAAIFFFLILFVFVAYTFEDFANATRDINTTNPMAGIIPQAPLVVLLLICLVPILWFMIGRKKD